MDYLVGFCVVCLRQLNYKIYGYPHYFMFPTVSEGAVQFVRSEQGAFCFIPSFNLMVKF